MSSTLAVGGNDLRDGEGGREVEGTIMLFGVRFAVDSMRKSVSLNNLSQYEQPQELNNNEKESSGKDHAAPLGCGISCGYASAEDAVPHSSERRSDRKRGVPWTEEEHKLFLLGLKKVGKGDWRGISRNFVKTRTPTQVASHAQKYFLRRANHNRRRRRSSLFDITTDSVTATPMEDEQSHNHNQEKKTSPSHSHLLLPPPRPKKDNIRSFSLLPSSPVATNPVLLPGPIESSSKNLSLTRQDSQGINLPANLIHPIPVIQRPQPSVNYEHKLDLNVSVDPSPLSVKLSLPSDQMETSTASHSAFQVMSSINNGDSIIYVA